MNHLSVEHVGSGKAGYVCEWEGCDRCDESKGFAQRQKVMRHLQTHTGEPSDLLFHLLFCERFRS